MSRISYQEPFFGSLLATLTIAAYGVFNSISCDPWQKEIATLKGLNSCLPHRNMPTVVLPLIVPTFLITFYLGFRYLKKYQDQKPKDKISKIQKRYYTLTIALIGNTLGTFFYLFSNMINGNYVCVQPNEAINLASALGCTGLTHNTDIAHSLCKTGDFKICKNDTLVNLAQQRGDKMAELNLSSLWIQFFIPQICMVSTIVLTLILKYKHLKRLRHHSNEEQTQELITRENKASEMPILKL